MKSSWVFTLLHPLLGACLWASVAGYKPVIIVHGLFDSSVDFKHLKLFINQVSCVTNVELVQSDCFCSCDFDCVDISADVEQNVQ